LSLKGKVIESTGSWYKVAINDNPDEIIKCRLPGRFRQREFNRTNPLAVGDQVSFTINEEDDTGSIQKIHERANYITRLATHGKGKRQILASNIDRAYVIQSVRKPRYKQGFIDRFLITCEALEIPPLLIMNKMDLVSDEQKKEAEKFLQIYENIGYPTLQTSIHDDSSIQNLADLLADSTSVFIGPSGVGKSSLLNTIDPSLDLDVTPVSDFNEKGQHTTTFARLHPVDSGGYIIDTPGIREFGLVDIDVSNLTYYFPEMIEASKECQFNDCAHIHEPKCGVKAALEEGRIHPKRYQSYRNLRDDLKN
jgi:ribosome biogenesis GTPase